eukprot:746945-Alexandrium_andersonii.AAC.1
MGLGSRPPSRLRQSAPPGVLCALPMPCAGIEITCVSLGFLFFAGRQNLAQPVCHLRVTRFWQRLQRRMPPDRRCSDRHDGVR